MAAVAHAPQQRPFKSYKVLGDEDDFVEQQQAAAQAAAAAEQAAALLARPTVSTASQDDYPADVWAAACRSADGGAAILQAYQDIWAYIHSVGDSLVQAAPQQDAALPPAMASGRPHPPLGHPLLHSGRQLWAPPSSASATLAQQFTLGATGPGAKPTLPPLAGTTSGKLFTGGKQTLTDAVRATKDYRRLGLFGEQQDVWDGVEAQLANATQRPLEDLAMRRGPEFRLKQEVVEAIQRAKPLQDRIGGPDTWNMSLRNAWERVVPLGSLFSGLTVTIREMPPSASGPPARLPHDKEVQRKAHERLVQIGRPLEPPPPGKLPRPASRSVFDKSALLGRSLTRRARDWHSSDVLKARLEQYADAIYRQFPYHPDMLALKVHGHAVVASQLQTALRQVVGLADVVEHLLATDREGAGQEAQRVLEQLQREVEEQEEARRRAEDEAAEAERLALRAQGGLAACEPGIHVGVSHTSTLLHCVQGQQDACELNLTNKGTVALSYCWERMPVAPHPLAAGATSHSSSAPSSSSATQPHSTAAAASLHAVNAEGELLPGEVATTTITFRPLVAGVVSETWTLRTVPELPAQEQGPPTVQVRGAATCPPSGAPARSALEQQLAHDEKMAKVHAAVEHLLHVAGPSPPRPPPETEEQRLEAQAWDSANAGAWPPLYHPDAPTLAQLRDLYLEARAALASALKPVEAAPTGKKPAAPAKGGKGAAPVEEAPPPLAWPEAWSLSVDDIAGVLAELDAAEQQQQQQQQQAGAAAAAPPSTAGGAVPSAPPTPLPPQAAALRARLHALLASQSVRVPRNARVLMRHTARAALGRVVDALDAKLQAVRADYQQRVAEAAQAAEAAAATPGAPAPPAGPTPQWLADKSKAGAKVQVKGLVNAWWDEVGKEKGAAADWVEQALAGIASSAELSGAEAPGSEASHHWARFALLREWVRLGLPPRGDIQ